MRVRGDFALVGIVALVGALWLLAKRDFKPLEDWSDEGADTALAAAYCGWFDINTVPAGAFSLASGAGSLASDRAAPGILPRDPVRRARILAML